MLDYTHGLNEEQKKAVLHKDGPLLIVAGAGAGKTKTLTQRILALIQNGVSPKNILAVTFTNKAAGEMKERVHSLLEKDGIRIGYSNEPFIGTFHSLGVRILRAEHEALQIPKNFTILDQDDSKAFVRDAIKAKNLDPKQYEPKKIRDAISHQKGECITAQKFYEGAQGFYPRLVADVWLEYEKRLSAEGALDFDDLLLQTLRLLRKNQAIREKYQELWKYIHIDEYQDTNAVQYEMSRALAENHKNICVVGDVDQCFPGDTFVSTNNEPKQIKNIREGDFVLSAAGNGETCSVGVTAVKKRHYAGELLEIQTKSGRFLRVTPEHLFFARFSLRSDIYYVYLMYKKEKGFRVGMVQGSRKPGYSSKENQIGFLVRCNQEHADRMWVIRVCFSRQDAAYWEYFYSISYGLPTVVFSANGHKISLDQKGIDALFQNIDTKKCAERLFTDTGLSFDHPHYTPQGTTSLNTKNKRLNVRLVLFSDKRKSAVKPFGLSRVSINTTDIALKEKLLENGFSVRKGKRDDWRLEMARLDYGEAEELAQKLLKIDPELILYRSAKIVNGGGFSFLPAASLRATMEVPLLVNGKMEVDTIESISKKDYSGDVYDLNVEKTHSYIANEIAVHNCIYSWRGANIKNMLRFEKDYAGATTIFLEENYRSTQNILSAANEVIQKNRMRVPKNLFTRSGSGEKITVFEAYDESGEGSFVAEKCRELVRSGVNPREIAVLFRANFQSRAIEEAMIDADIPYQVLGVKFFDRKEVKDVLAFLRASLNPKSAVDLKRIINVPPRGIGDTTLKKILAGQKDSLPASMKAKIANFEATLVRIREKALVSKPSDTVKFILKESGMENKLSLGGEEEEDQLENLHELVTLASKYDPLPPEEGIQRMLEDAALASDQDSIMHKKDGDMVRLMTIHAAKGLEFDTVFITGLEDGLFPHKAMDGGETNEHKEEERRLFYVALTRAKKRLFITYTSIRTIFGSRQINAPSEFLGDIPEDLIEKEADSGTEKRGKIIYF